MDEKPREYIDLPGLDLYNQLQNDKLNQAIASSYKTIKFNKETNVVSFYKSEIVSDNDTPDFTITLSDLSNVLNKLVNPVAGNVVIVNADGTISDGNVKLSDLATNISVNTAIQNATHLQKAIITEIPTVEEANDNTIYLKKIESAAGNDKYEEYMKIGDEIVCIGDTSIDLSGYATIIALENAITRITALEDKVKEGFTPITNEQIQSLFNAQN